MTARASNRFCRPGSIEARWEISIARSTRRSTIRLFADSAREQLAIWPACRKWCGRSLPDMRLCRGPAGHHRPQANRGGRQCSDVFSNGQCRRRRDVHWQHRSWRIHVRTDTYVPRRIDRRSQPNAERTIIGTTPGSGATLPYIPGPPLSTTSAGEIAKLGISQGARNIWLPTAGWSTEPPDIPDVDPSLRVCR